MSTPKWIAVLSGATALFLFQSIDLFNVLNTPPLQFLSSKTLANQFRGYVPPVTRKPIERTDGAGSRGCPRGSYGAISLLAPNDHVGLTATGRPTFSWYVSAIPLTSMQFSLVEPGIAKPVLVKKLKVHKTGFFQLELPENIPELSVGKQYRWTVSLVCSEKRPSLNIYVRSWIQRVDLSSKEDKLGEPLNGFSNIRDRATFYAHSGFWYDAVAEMSKAYLNHPEDPLNAKYLRQLLQQVGLSQISVQRQETRRKYVSTHA